MHPRISQRIFQSTAAAAVLALLPACLAMPPDGEAVTAQRPTLSSDTATSYEGTFEVEGGLAFDPSDSFDSPVSVKYGVGPATEVFLGLSPYQSVDQGGADGDGFGDLTLGTRHRFWEEADGPGSAAFQLVTKLPTGDEDEGLSTGEVDFFGAGIYTAALDVATLTGYYELGVLGEDPGSGSDLQHVLAVAAARNLHQHVGVFGELATVLLPEGEDSVLATLGATYAVSSSLVFDAGVVLGLDEDAPDAVFQVGFTTNYGPIF